jgi:PIN domain nuclease of toxin-antitoxin system
VKRVAIDTHALTWHLSKPAKLGKEAKRLLRMADAGKLHVLIPAACLVELALLREIGRPVVGPEEVHALVSQHPCFSVLPMGLEQVRGFVPLAGVRDPFDRMIIAAARNENVPLLTADESITRSALVETIWD